MQMKGVAITIPATMSTKILFTEVSVQESLRKGSEVTEVVRNLVATENQACHQEDVCEGNEAGKPPWTTGQQATKAWAHDGGIV